MLGLKRGRTKVVIICSKPGTVPIESLNIVLTATMTDFLLQDADTSGVRGCLHRESMSQILAMVLAAGAMGVTAVLTVEVKVKTPARAVEGITELK